MANLRLSNAVLGGLARPEFAENAGLAIGAGMLGVSRRKEDEQKRLVQQSTLELLRKAQVAQETGDLGMLTGTATDLDVLLSETKNEESRQLILDSINKVNAARGATKTQQQTNTAMSIIKTEQALEDLKDKDARRSAGELVEVTPFEERQRKALESRLATMKQNGAALVEADNIKYQSKLEAAKRQNQLAEQQKQIAMRALSSTRFNSDEYKQNAKELREKGFGQAVDQYETTQYALVEAKEKADAIRRSTAPLTNAEEKMLRDNNFTPTGDIRRDRDRLALITETLDKRTIAMANRQSGEVVDVKSHVEVTLQNLRDAGDLPLNLFDDLYNKIDDLLNDPSVVDQIAGLLERPAGERLSSAEIQDEVTTIIKSKYPEQFKDAETYRNAQIKQSQRLEFLTFDLMAQAGLADRNDDGTITVKKGVDEEDIRRFRAEAERRMSVTGTIVRSITSPKADTAIGDIDIYSPVF